MDEFLGGLVCGGFALVVPAIIAVVAVVAMARRSQGEVDRLRSDVELLRVELRGLKGLVLKGRDAPLPTPSAAPATAVPLPETPPVAVLPAEPRAAPVPPVSLPPGAVPPASPPPVRPALPPSPGPFDLGAFIEQNAVWAFAAVGGLLLVIAALFGLREAILHGWFGPTARFATGIGVGLGAWFVAELLRWRGFTIPASALTGAGASILYATLYAGHARWGLISQPVTFAAMVALTAVTMLTAWRRDSRFVAWLSLVGGYATPVLLSTGENKAVAFFGYLALVNAGAVLAAARRKWPEVVAFAGIVTASLYLAWAAQWRAPDQVLVGLGAAALFAFGFALLVPAGDAVVAGAATVVALILWLCGALALATPTDILRVDPRSSLPLPWDLGQTAWFGAAYLALGAALLPRLLRRWAPAQAATGVSVGLAAAVFALAWTLAGEPRWTVVATTLPLLAIVGFASGGVATGVPVFVGSAFAAFASGGVERIPAEIWPQFAGGMLAAALAGAWWRGARWLLPLAAVGLAAPLYVHLGARLDDGEAAALLLVAVPLYAALALAPFLAPRRGDLWGVLGAAIVPVAVFWPLLSAWDRVLGDGYSGLLPVLLGANSLMGAVSLVRTARAELGDNELAILVAVTLLAVAVAIPVQLDEAWLTVGWAIEVALLAWARRRIPHGLLTGAAALLAVAVSLRLLLNPWALEYGHAEGLPILNWTLYTWGVPLVAFLVAARLFESAWMRGGLRTASVFIAFALLNLEIAHAFAVDGQLSFRSERLGEEMTRSIAWGGYGLGLVLLGIRNRSRATRLFGLAFAVLGAGKVFLVDMWSLSGFARVGAFGGMAVTLLAAAVAFAWLARADSSPSNAPEKSP